MVITLSYTVSQTMIIPSLPPIQEATDSSPGEASWILTSFQITAAIGTLMIGRLGDLFSKRRVMLICLLIFGCGSFVAAITTEIEVLIAGRSIQGLSAAIVPLAIGAARDQLSPDRITFGIGVLAAMFGVGGILGFVFSGLIIDGPGYQAIFWLCLIFAVFSAITTFIGLAPSPPAAVEEPAEPKKSFFPGLGAQVWLNCLVTLTVSISWMSLLVVIPQLVQADVSDSGFGGTATLTGIYLIPMQIAMLATGLATSAVVRRLGFKPAIFGGAACSATGIVYMIFLHGAPADILVGSALFGGGLGLATGATSAYVAQTVPLDLTAGASSVNNVMRTIAGAIGAPIAGAALTATLAPSGVLSTPFTFAFALAAVPCVLATVIATRISEPTGLRNAA